MVLRRRDQTIEHRHFREIASLLQPDDLLVLNNTRVLPARLKGIRVKTGGKWQGLFLQEDTSTSGSWKLMGQTRGRLGEGERIRLQSFHGSDELDIELIQRLEDGTWRVQPLAPGSAAELLARFGTMPLPPYMGKATPDELDFERYQTVFHQTPGSIAAPTAGLHFTPDLLDECRSRGVKTSFVTLHVGIGTFRPVSAERLADHVMHQEWCQLSDETACAIEQARQQQQRIVAVGTTSLRTMESWRRHQQLSGQGWSGSTNLFIYPPYEFQAVNTLVTNFHLPESTLLMLVCAFAGYDFTMAAYQEAIGLNYRFFSYGDAMIILP